MHNKRRISSCVLATKRVLRNFEWPFGHLQMTVSMREAAGSVIAQSTAFQIASTNARAKLEKVSENIRRWQDRRAVDLFESRCSRIKFSKYMTWKFAAKGHWQTEVRAENLLRHIFFRLLYRTLTLWREVLLHHVFFSSREAISVCHFVATCRRRLFNYLQSWRYLVHDASLTKAKTTIAAMAKSSKMQDVTVAEFRDRIRSLEQELMTILVSKKRLFFELDGAKELSRQNGEIALARQEHNELLTAELARAQSEMLKLRAEAEQSCSRWLNYDSIDTYVFDEIICVSYRARIVTIVIDVQMGTGVRKSSTAKP